MLGTQAIPEIKSLNSSAQSSRIFWSGQLASQFKRHIVPSFTVLCLSSVNMPLLLGQPNALLVNIAQLLKSLNNCWLFHPSCLGRIKDCHNGSGIRDSWSWSSSNFYHEDTMDLSYTDSSFYPIYSLQGISPSVMEVK